MGKFSRPAGIIVFKDMSKPCNFSLGPAGFKPLILNPALVPNLGPVRAFEVEHLNAKGAHSHFADNLSLELSPLEEQTFRFHAVPGQS